MIQLLKVLIFSALFSFSFASRINSREEDSDEEKRLNSNKRLRRGPDSFNNYEIDYGVKAMTGMMKTTGLVSEPVDPALKAFNDKVAGLTDRQLQNVIDDSFFNLKFDFLKYLHKRGLLDDNVNGDHLFSLCRSFNSTSFEILEYLIKNNIPSAIRACNRELLVNLLKNCTITSLKKFKLLWCKFDGHLLPFETQRDILYMAAANHANGAYSLILRSQNSPDIASQLIKSVFNRASIGFNSESIWNFFMNRGVSFQDNLSLSYRVDLLTYAARNCKVELTEYLLGEESTLEGLINSEFKPWQIALQNDCTEILRVYMKNFEIAPVEFVIQHAFKMDKPSIVEFLKAEGYFSQENLENVAVLAMNSNDFGIISQCILHGLDVKKASYKRGINLFNIAVMRDNLASVEYFLDACDIDVNKVYEKVDPNDYSEMIFTCLYYANSREMVKLLARKGADLNFVHIMFDVNGDVISEFTRMNLAAEARETDVYEALEELGADPNINNEKGDTSSEIYDSCESEQDN